MSFKTIGKSKFSLKKYKSSFKRVPTTTSASESDTSRNASPIRSSSDSSIQIHTSASEIESTFDIDERSELEKELFQLVENGDTDAVQQFLKENVTVNINQRDKEGSSVLHKAVMNEDSNMVDTLLAEDLETDINDALLHAIKENSMQMVLKLLKHKDKTKKRKSVIKKLFPKFEITENEFDSTVYGAYVTPLLMAALSGHYEIIELLYNRGERLGELHLRSCTCTACTSGDTSRDLKKTNNRIHLLRGLANPTYIAFLAGVDKNFDPILNVFQIQEDIKKCMQDEPEFRLEYEEILNEIKPFPVDMLSLCRCTTEIMKFLRVKSGYTGSSSLNYPRLLLALDLRQKEFVAHPHAQDILYQDWIGEPWITTNFCETLLRRIITGLLVLLSPIFSLLFWLALCCCQKAQWVKFVTSPVNRFWSSCVSSVAFLVVLFYINTTEKGQAELGPPSFYLPWVVGAFVLSYIFSSLSHFLINRKYFWDGWNKFECINQVFFKATISLWIYLWKTKKGVNDSSNKDKTGKTHHLVQRNELEPFDSTLLAEVTLGVASTMAALKPLRAFMLHPNLGPLQVALGKMTRDIGTFVVFFAVILVSFALGAQHLYRPYSSFTNSKGELISENKILAKFFSAIEAFYWAMFTMTDAGSPSLDPIPISSGNGTLANHHFVTESVGKVIFVAFHILTVTFLLNMLTGVMSNTYGRILENVNAEWKHARSRIWVYYIHDDVVTGPLNIISNGVSLLNIFTWIRSFRSSKSSKKRTSLTNLDIMETAGEQNDKEYRILIRRLLQRYFRAKNSTASDDPPAKSDVVNVQNHVFELKGMTTLTLEKDPSPLPSIRPSAFPVSDGSTVGATGTVIGSTLTTQKSELLPAPSNKASIHLAASAQPMHTYSVQETSPKFSRHVNFPLGGSTDGSDASMRKEV